MTAVVQQLERYMNRGYYGFFEDWDEDFLRSQATVDLNSIALQGRWNPLTADSSSPSTLVINNTTLPGGILSLTQDATDNDELYFNTLIQPFLIASGKPMFFEIRLNAAELATSTNNVMVGFLSGATAANQLLDNGGGPVASATMAVIYKIDGGTVWRCRSQVGAAVGQTDTISQQSSTPAASGTYSTLRIEVQPISSTVAEVAYSMSDGVTGMAQMTDANNNPIKHQLVYTNAVACGAFFGCKTGAANAEVLLVDYVTAWQKR